MKLYQFEKLKRKMDELGFPQIIGHTGFQMIKGVDFEKAFREGSIAFEKDGIYLEYDGKKHKGYMFIKEPYIEAYNSYPKFHITNCNTIEKFIANGKFDQRYEFSNSNVNDLIDFTSRNLYRDQVLDCCINCKRALSANIKNTEDFFKNLDKSQIQEKIEVDMFGYVKDKEKISRQYRELKEYTCENCGVKPKSKLHQIYWHVHHIDGNKLDNTLKNLRCLCILCHANVDERHVQNFSTRSNQRRIKSFKSSYINELHAAGNPFFEMAYV